MPKHKQQSHKELENLLWAMAAWFAGFIASLVVFWVCIAVSRGLVYPSASFYVVLCLSVLSAPTVFIALLKHKRLHIKNKRVICVIGLTLYLVLYAVLITLFIAGLRSLDNMSTRII